MEEEGDRRPSLGKNVDEEVFNQLEQAKEGKFVDLVKVIGLPGALIAALVKRKEPMPIGKRGPVKEIPKKKKKK